MAKPKPKSKPKSKPPAKKRQPAGSSPAQDALLEAILADPTDDRARLVYADALQDLGDPRGELVALQISGGKSAEARAKQLLEKHRKTWQDFGAKGARYTWARGFIDRVAAKASVLIAAGPRMFELHPVRDLRIHDSGAKAPLAAILEFPLRCVTHLQVNDLTPGDLRAFAEATTLPNLVDLDLGGTRIGKLAAVLGASTAFPKLQFVHLGRAGLSNGQLADLVQGKFLANVISLGLADNPLTADGARALAAAPWTSKLEILNLSRNELTDAGLAHLARSPHLTNLKTLYLENFPGAPDGAPPPYGMVAAKALAAAATTTFANLAVLDMSWSLTAEAARVVSAAYGKRLVMRTERFA
jgi:uncharacterized protein (TIGR02996 family)